MENKLVDVKMEGEKLTISLDFDRDGEKVIDIVIHNKEALSEVMNAVGKLFKK